MSADPTVFVIDDNLGVRNSLRALMKSAGLAVETYESGEEFLEAYEPERPGCLVLDVRLRAGASGLDLQDELRARKATLPIIVLTGHGTVPTSVRALKAGAVDFLQKPVRQSVGGKNPRCHRGRSPCARRSDGARRRQVACRATYAARARGDEATVDGKTTKEIAYDLHLSARTVEAHRRTVLRKMNVTSAAQLVRVVIATPGGVAD